MSNPADNTGRCKVCGLALQVRGCTPGDCRTRPKGAAMVEMYARPPSDATAVAPADKPPAHPLQEDLRRRVVHVSLDCMPAYYTATLVDQGSTFTASGQDDRPGTAERLEDDVVAQALAARKAGG